MGCWRLGRLAWDERICGVADLFVLETGKLRLELIHERLIALRQSVILHVFSDGGFGMARSILGMWEDSWQAGEAQQSPEALKCIIYDGAGLLPHEYPSDVEQVEPDGLEWQRQNQFTALAFFTGCGLNMLMTFGACEAFHQEPANSFGKVLVATANANLLGPELFSAPRGPLREISKLLARPSLLIASKGDKVVPLERSQLLETWLKSLGAEVKLLIFEKAMHCRGMLSHTDDYWQAVDALVASSDVS